MSAEVEAAIIALFGVLISLIVSLYVSQKAVFINSVTVERSKWIDKLRENLAEFLRTCSSILLETDKQSPEFKEKQSKADGLIALIKLQLNPNDEIDGNIIEFLGKLPEAAEKGENYRKLENKFIGHCQFLIKEEWEKVKSEAKNNLFGPSCDDLRKLNERKRKYKDFTTKQ